MSFLECWESFPGSKLQHLRTRTEASLAVWRVFLSYSLSRSSPTVKHLVWEEISWNAQGHLRKHLPGTPLPNQLLGLPMTLPSPILPIFFPAQRMS